MALSHSPSIVTSNLSLALDPANKKSYSQNEFVNSTDLVTWSGTSGHNTCTVSRDTITSPVGSNPLKMVVTGDDPYTNTYNSGTTWNIAPAVNGQRWIASVYVKASQATTGEIVLFGANTSGTSFVSGSWLSINGGVTNITTEWTRISTIIDMTNASVAYIQARFDGPQTGGSGITVWWDGLQIERVSSTTTTPTPYTSLYTAGNTIKDLSNNSRNGTLLNYPQYSTDSSGAFVFSATAPYINLTSSTYGITDAYTVSFWVKRTGGTGVFLYIGVNSSATGMYFESYTNTDLYTWFFGTNPSQNTGNWGANTLSTTQWTNITMTMVTSTKTQIRYINGVLSGTTTLPNSIVAPSSAGIWRIINPTQTWTGSISALQIYNRVLTADEVQQNFNALRGRFGV